VVGNSRNTEFRVIITPVMHVAIIRAVINIKDYSICSNKPWHSKPLLFVTTEMHLGIHVALFCNGAVLRNYGGRWRSVGELRLAALLQQVS
jgi:hypothetical protein